MTLSDNLRVLAERYLALSKVAVDPTERGKLPDYASAFADLAKRIEQHERRFHTGELVNLNADPEGYFLSIRGPRLSCLEPSLGGWAH